MFCQEQETEEVLISRKKNISWNGLSLMFLDSDLKAEDYNEETR